MKKQAKFVVGTLIVIVSLGWLTWVGAKESKTYYHTIAELSAPKGALVEGRLAPRHLRGRQGSGQVRVEV